MAARIEDGQKPLRPEQPRTAHWPQQVPLLTRLFLVTLIPLIAAIAGGFQLALDADRLGSYLFLLALATPFIALVLWNVALDLVECCHD